MADNYLITGYWGEPHVTSENDRGINAAIFGVGRFVLSVGEQFRAEYIGNNTIRMYDGKLVDNGAAAGIPAGEYVDLLIANAGQGMNRNDLIVFQYSQDPSTLIESGVFTVVQGEESETTAEDPELTQEDLLSGSAAFDQMALWRVSVSGTAISAPVRLFETATLGMSREEAEFLFAPDGHGLGVDPSNLMGQFDTDMKSGWYGYFGDNLIENDDTTNAGLIRVDYHRGAARQTLYPSTISTGTVSRSMGGDGVWTPWGYDSPNRGRLNVEMRTSEWYGNRPVYVKNIQFAPTEGNGTVTMNIGILPANIVTIDAHVVGNYYFPLNAGNAGVFAAYYYVDESGVFGVRTTSSLMDGMSVFATIKYTKP